MAIGSGITTIIHAVLAVFLIIELGLTGYVVSRTDVGWWRGSPSQYNFMLFNSIWSMVVLAYVALTPRFVERLFHNMVAAGLLAVTTLFWFAGSIAMAVFVGVPHCNGPFCTVIQSAQAAVAFGFFIWILFTLLTVLDGMGFLRGGARADTTRKPSQPLAGV